MRDFPISGSGPFQTTSSSTLWSSRGNFGPHHCFSFMGPPNYDRYRKHYNCSLYQETGRDPFPYLAMSSSGSVPMATNSRHSHPGQTHSGLSKPKSSSGRGELQHWTCMLATVHNTHLPQFVSPISEPRALAIDALSQDWQGSLMFMFPPFPLLSKVIQNSGPPRRAK